MREGWIIGIIICLLIIAIVLGFYSYYQNQVELQEENQKNIFYNFSVNDGDPPVTLSCPVGQVVELVDAWYEVYDPNFQCAAIPSPCSPAISNDGKLVWPSGGQCSDLGCSDENATPSDAWESVTDKEGNQTYRNKYCGYDKNGNPTSSSGSPQCLSMNALGYLANVVNGQSTVSIDASPNGNFGPSPCTSSITSIKPISTSECGEINPVFPTMTYANSKPDPSSSPSLTVGFQGVYGHGIYTCVPESELTQ